MKKILIALMALLVMGTTAMSAQTTKEIVKERKVLARASKSELEKRASRTARKVAKKLRKQGWQVVPGALPLEKQLDKSYMMQYEYDEDLFPKYLMGEAMSIGEHYDAAKMQALELAKQNLAGQIQTEVTALVKGTVANEQLKAEEAASITEILMVSENLISQSIGRTITMMEAYRTLKNKNKEVLVRIAYNGDMAKESAKEIVREELRKKGDELHNKLDGLLGW